MISEGYRSVLQAAHRAEGWGTTGHKHAESILSRTKPGDYVLDYGCGKGTLAPACPGRNFWHYDPGRGLDVLPETPFDLVACLDVLEHVEPEHLSAVLAHIKGLAPRAFFVIGLGPAKKILPDGRNAHLIQMPPEWWTETLQQAGFSVLESRITPKNLQLHTESRTHE